MKRIFILMLVLSLMFLLLPASISAATDVNVYLDNVLIDAKGIILSGSTLVPLKAIFEELGASVAWDNETKTVTSKKGFTTIELTVGKDTAKINGADVQLAAPGQVINGSIMVPLRFVVEAFGGTLKWDGETKSAYINTGRIELVFSDYKKINTYPTHVLKVDREILPGSIKNFKYVLSSGISEPVGEIGEYLVKKQLLEEGIENDIDRIKNDPSVVPYDDVNGIRVSSYGYNSLTFYDDQSNLLGYVIIKGVMTGAVKTQLYSETKIEDVKKPENFDQLYNHYLNLPSLTEGLTVTVLDKIGIMEFDPSMLPDNLQHASSIEMGTTSVNAYEELIATDIITGIINHNGAPVGDEIIRIGTLISTGKNALVRLFDGNGDQIAVTIVKPNQFITSDPRYVYFEGEVYTDDGRISEEDFIVERYINGVLDVSSKRDGFNYLFNYGGSFGTNSGIRNDEEGVEDKITSIFHLGPLFRESDAVEYKFTSLNEDLRNIVMKHY